MKSKKLLIIPIAVRKEYYCSENSLSTLLYYYGKKISPDQLHRSGCDAFSTIKKCVPPSFVRKKGSLSIIKKSINSQHPVLISIIPDANVKKNERHTVLVYGYTERSVLIVDNGIKTRLEKKTVKRVWHRTNNDMWVHAKVIK